MDLFFPFFKRNMCSKSSTVSIILGILEHNNCASFWRNDHCNLGYPPSQDSSQHQDYEPFLGSGIPT